MVLGAIPFGILFGALAINAGLSPAAAMGMSLFVFAGSAQFIAAGLYAQDAAISIIILTTFVVNLRHALYSASLGPYMKSLSQKWLLPLGFWLTDETYAVVVRRYPQDDYSAYRHWYHLGSSVFMYVNWNICTVIGMIAGQQLEGLADLGLDFALVVTFIAIVVPLVISRPMVVCVLVAAATSVLTNNLPNKLGLMIAALLGILAGMIADAISNHRRITMPTTVEQEATP